MDKNQAPIVEYKKVSKAYKDLMVLKQIDFQIYPGEKVVLIGGSGSGKTTLARLLMTLEEPTSGEIIINKEHLYPLIQKSKNKIHQRLRNDMGMVFQQFNLFPHLTILQNVMEAPLTVQKRKKKEAKELAIRILEKVGLGDRLDYYPSQLSGGQTQRAAIARALAVQPKILIFDEPTSALDPELVGEVLKVIKEIAKEGNTAMLLITHEMRFAKEIADRVCFFEKGVIAEQGSPEKIFGNPDTQRLREFLSAYIEENKKGLQGEI